MNKIKNVIKKVTDKVFIVTLKSLIRAIGALFKFYFNLQIMFMK